MRDKRLDNRPTADHEMLLIRVGHHLWRSRQRKEWPETGVNLALACVWQAKEEIRVPLRKQWLETVKNRAEILAKARANA